MQRTTLKYHDFNNKMIQLCWWLQNFIFSDTCFQQKYAFRLCVPFCARLASRLAKSANMIFLQMSFSKLKLGVAKCRQMQNLTLIILK